MRILLLTPYPPYPPHGGGRQRIYQLIKGLSERHEVSCISFSPSPEASAAAAPLRSLCKLTLIPSPSRSLTRRAVQTLLSPLPDMVLRAPSPAMALSLRTLLGELPFDVVQAESIEMAQYLALATQGQLRLLDQFNAEYVLQRRAALTDLHQPRRLHAGLYSLIQWRKLARYERRICGSLDRVLVVSQEDRQALRALDPRLDPAIIPNGVDTDYFCNDQPDPGGETLLFTGTMDFRPNIDAVRWFVAQVLPHIRARRPGALLRIVGRQPAAAVRALAQPGVVEVAGEVDDIREAFARAAAYVVPMRIGGGVRLKLLEALSMALPVISTSMGAEGVEVLRHGEHCLLADQPEAFAAAVLQLLEDRALARRLGAAGRQLARERYDWRSIVPRLEQVYAEHRSLIVDR